MFFFFFLFVFIEFMLANRGDPDQTPCSRASDLGLHCLPLPPLWKWVKPKKIENKTIHNLFYLLDFKISYIFQNVRFMTFIF